ncbi:hypothetical protein BT69DRAFT_1127671 [Atractiella rhizophila]|nr:hypothetical protein BT69DRAFT_1127671 [Atractiella rhizophila]
MSGLFQLFRLASRFTSFSYRGIRVTTQAAAATFNFFDAMGDALQAPFNAFTLSPWSTPFSSWFSAQFSTDTTITAPPASMPTSPPSSTTMQPTLTMTALFWHMLAEQLQGWTGKVRNLLEVMLFLALLWVVFCRGWVYRTIRFLTPAPFSLLLPRSSPPWPILPPGLVRSIAEEAEAIRPRVSCSPAPLPRAASSRLPSVDPAEVMLARALSEREFTLDTVRKPFTGEDFGKFKDFQREIRSIIRSYPHKYASEERRVGLFIHNLRGRAADMVESEETTLGVDSTEQYPFQSLEQAEEFIRARLGGEQQLSIDMDKLLALKNESDTPVNKFVADFNIQASSINPPDFRDFFLKHLFMKSLKESVRVEIAKIPHYLDLDWVELTNKAIAFDLAMSSKSKTGKTELGAKTSTLNATKEKPSTNVSPATKSKSNSNATAPPKPEHLDADGHLTAAEKERRRVNNLCGYCGAHPKDQDCPNTRGSSNRKK